MVFLPKTGTNLPMCLTGNGVTLPSPRQKCPPLPIPLPNPMATVLVNNLRNRLRQWQHTPTKLPGNARQTQPPRNPQQKGERKRARVRVTQRTLDTLTGARRRNTLIPIKLTYPFTVVRPLAFPRKKVPMPLRFPTIRKLARPLHALTSPSLLINNKPLGSPWVNPAQLPIVTFPSKIQPSIALQRIHNTLLSTNDFFPLQHFPPLPHHPLN